MDIYSFFLDISGIYCVYLNVDEYEMNVLTAKILFWVQAKHPMIIPRDSWSWAYPMGKKVTWFMMTFYPHVFNGSLRWFMTV